MKFSQIKYERPDYESFGKQMNEFAEKLREAKTFEEAYAIHEEATKLYNHLASMLTVCHIRHDIDTTDEFYEKEQDPCRLKKLQPLHLRVLRRQSARSRV